MLTAGAESLIRQARGIQDEELERFCLRVSKLLQEDLGPATVDALQRLFLIVSATKYPRRLEKTCVDLLQTTLCLPTCPEQLQVLCAAILREMSPLDSLTLTCDRAQNTQQLGLVASVLLAQLLCPRNEDSVQQDINLEDKDLILLSQSELVEETRSTSHGSQILG